MPLPEEVPPDAGEDHHGGLVARWSLSVPVHQGVGGRGVGHRAFAVEAVEAEEAQDLAGPLQLAGAHAAPPVHGGNGGVLPAQGRRACQSGVDAAVGSSPRKPKRLRSSSSGFASRFS